MENKADLIPVPYRYFQFFDLRTYLLQKANE